MKELQKGESITISHIVKNEDVASFQGKVVHNVCSTFTLAREVEWSSRQFVIKYKDDHEEGVGTMLTINHRSPAFVGEKILIEAVVESCINNELICTYKATVGDRLVAEGKTGQKVLNKSSLEKIFSKFEGNE